MNRNYELGSNQGLAIKNIFCPPPPPSCVLCARAEIILGGAEKDSSSDQNIFAPPTLKVKSAPYEKNPGHISVHIL